MMTPTASLVSRLTLLAVLFTAAAVAGDFSYRVEGFTCRVGVEIDSVLHWAEAPAGGSEPGDRVVLRLARSPVTLEWRRDSSGVVSVTLRNPGTAPLKLGRLILARAENVPGEMALVMSGWQLSNTVQSTVGKKLVSKTLLQLWAPATREAVQFGFTSFDRINTGIEIEGGVVTAGCDFDGFMLAPGATIESERLRIARGDDPMAALRAWGDAAAGHYRPRIWPTTPAGWVGWSWVDPFNSENYEEVVRRNARAIREKIPGADIGYIWVSIGNLKNREAGNWLEWNHAAFPSGPQTLVRDLAALDYKLGLWAGVFWLNSRLETQVTALRDAFLQKDGQPLTVPHRDLGAQYIMDPSHPKTLARFDEVFRTWREWGIRYYMIDFMDAVAGATIGRYLPDSYANPALVPGPQTLREALKTIRRAAGPDTYLLGSTGPTFQTVGLLDGARAGTDYGEGRPIDGPGRGFYPATFVVNRANYWTSHQRAVQAWATHFFVHRKLFIADSGNVLTIDKPVPLPDAQISATIFGLNGSPLMIGDDVDRMSDERLALLRQQFPRLPEVAEPLDLFAAPDPDYPKTFRLRVATAWDNWDLLAVFNFTTEPLRQTLPASGAVWDFWEERYAGVVEKDYAVTVPPRSVRLLRVAPARAPPWILSTDIHIRQGQAELSHVAWDEANLELRFTTARRGNVFLRVPKEFRLAVPAGLWIAKDGNDSSLVVRVAADPGERRIRFAKM